MGLFGLIRPACAGSSSPLESIKPGHARWWLAMNSASRGDRSVRSVCDGAGSSVVERGDWSDLAVPRHPPSDLRCANFNESCGLAPFVQPNVHLDLRSLRQELAHFGLDWPDENPCEGFRVARELGRMPPAALHCPDWRPPARPAPLPKFEPPKTPRTRKAKDFGTRSGRGGIWSCGQNPFTRQFRAFGGYRFRSSG